MSKRALRFNTPAEMPSGMRALYDKQTGASLALDATGMLRVPAMLEGGEPAVCATGQPRFHRGRPVGATTGSGSNKFGAVATVVDGIRFDSKAEARYYERLKVRVAAGEVLYFLRQVSIPLPGKTRYVVDFMEVHADGSIHWVDVKGMETPIFKLKKRQIEELYPIELEVVR